MQANHAPSVSVPSLSSLLFYKSMISTPTLLLWLLWLPWLLMLACRNREQFASSTIGRALAGGTRPFYPHKTKGEAVAAGPPLRLGTALSVGAVTLAARSGNAAVLRPATTMRVELIGHFKPCMTGIYLHI